MSDSPGFRSPEALLASATARAGTAAQQGTLTKDQLLRQFEFSRLLARIYHAESGENWVLKGGLSALVRIPGGRATRDMDLLYRATEDDLDNAVAEFKVMIAVDLGDHFRFKVASEEAIPAKTHQPGVAGRSLSVSVFCSKWRPNITIDLVAENALTEQPERAVAESLPVPGITPPTVQLYPLVDHIADKVSATHTVYPGGRRSSRIRDMVDLVLFALTQTVDGAGLKRALAARSARVQHRATFDAPADWRDRYPSQARRLPLLADHQDFDVALALLSDFLDPALAGAANGFTWNPNSRRWEPHTPPATGDPS